MGEIKVETVEVLAVVMVATEGETEVEIEEVIEVAMEPQLCTRQSVMDVVIPQNFHLSQQEINQSSVAHALVQNEKSQVEVIEEIHAVETEEMVVVEIESHHLVEKDEMIEIDDQQDRTLVV